MKLFQIAIFLGFIPCLHAQTVDSSHPAFAKNGQDVIWQKVYNGPSPASTFNALGWKAISNEGDTMIVYEVIIPERRRDFGYRDATMPMYTRYNMPLVATLEIKENRYRVIARDRVPTEQVAVSQMFDFSSDPIMNTYLLSRKGEFSSAKHAATAQEYWDKAFSEFFDASLKKMPSGDW